ncbi:MAG: glycosyltransferase family 4 protein [Oscillochloris sp.]|nr:glycosyltransferase family 4 protein [Oscillochloris sp.]
MHILMLNYEYPPIGGGAAPITRALCEHLAAAGHHVDVVTMGYRKLPFCEDFYDGRLRVFRVPALRRSPVRAVTIEMSSYLVTALFWALWLTFQRRYDLIHAHFLMPTGVLAAILKRLRGLPLIVTIHGSDVPGYNPDRFKRGHRVLAPAWRKIVRNVDRIISPSAYLAGLLQRAYPTPVEVVPNGYDAATMPEIPRRKQILFVSRLFPRKGAQHLIAALKGLDLQGWEVIIAGDGPILDELKQQAAALNIPIRFPGFVKGRELHELYAGSEIFVFPSLHDNFPTVLLEALAAGCAIITNNVTGMPEVVGEAGILVKPHDIDGLQAAIKRLMDDETLRLELRRRAVMQVQHFSWDIVLTYHLNLYNQVLSQARALPSYRAEKHATRDSDINVNDA